MRAQKTLVCFGDSLTEGTVSSSYVKLVQQRLSPAVRVVNAGINGDTTLHLLRRVERDVVRHNPDVVTVLVGLNDIGTTSPEISTRGYYRTVKRMLRRIDVRYYAAVYRRIIAMLRERTHARIVLCTLTTLGENPNDPIQPYIDSYCNVIRALAVQEGLALVDLRRAFWAAITNDPRKVKPYTIWRPIFDGFSIGYRGETYTSIGMRRGYQLLCDGAHLSDVGADLVAREMLPVVEQALNSV